jgi:hypothetical protein
VDEERRRQLEAAAARRVEHGRGARHILDQIELTEAETWRQTVFARELGESAAVAELVAASKAAHTKQRQRRRILKRIAFTTLTVFIVVVAASPVAVLGHRPCVPRP